MMDRMGWLAEAEDVLVDIEERQLEKAFGVPGEHRTYWAAIQREVVPQLAEPDDFYVEDIAADVITQLDNGRFWCNAEPHVIRAVAEGHRR